MNSKLHEIYGIMLKAYGKQHWWPLLDIDGTNPTKTGSITGYHPNDYLYPKTNKQRLEIIFGALLTRIPYMYRKIETFKY